MTKQGFKADLGRSFAVVIAVTVIFLASCKPAPTTPTVIKIADMGWQSNVPVVNIMKIVLENELGYEVEFVPTLWAPPTFAALTNEPPDVDILAECWLPNFQPLVDEYVTDKGQADVVTTSYVGRQGFVVPTYVVEGDPERGIEPMAPDLRSVKQLNDYVDLFDRDHDGKGELVGKTLFMGRGASA